MSESIYNKIEKIEVTVKCTQPLHIGSSDGRNEEVLIHPVKKEPFIQATAIAGVFRHYCQKALGDKMTNELFGCTDNDGGDSIIKFSDGHFDTDSLKIEIRPRLAIDRVTRTCGNSKVKGTDITSGHKFSMHYVGAGTISRFFIYVYGEDKVYKENIVKCLEAVNSGDIQFGGQRSSGCGSMEVLEAKYHLYDMKNTTDRNDWIKQNEISNLEELVLSETEQFTAYEINIEAATEDEILIKSMAVNEYDNDSPDTENIRNANKEYIIPGSSIKGVFRSQMERIADYLGKDNCIIDNAFGKATENKEKGLLGNIRFADAVIGEIESNDMAELRHRIKVDKFTGSVMNKKLFTERNAHGTIRIAIKVLDDENSKESLALIALTVRDIAQKLVAFGSGSGVGKGFLDIHKVTITTKDKFEANMIFGQNPVVNDAHGVIKECLATLA